VQPVRNGAESSKTLERNSMTMFARLWKQREWLHLFWAKKANLRSHGLHVDKKEKVGMATRQWLVIQTFQNWSQNWHTRGVYFYQGDKRITSCITLSKFCKQFTNKPKKSNEYCFNLCSTLWSTVLTIIKMSNFLCDWMTMAVKDDLEKCGWILWIRV
jgi:hypothetical protein